MNVFVSDPLSQRKSLIYQSSLEGIITINIVNPNKLYIVTFHFRNGDQ